MNMLNVQVTTKKNIAVIRTIICITKASIIVPH